MAPTLAYWPIRGNAQQIRLLLAYTESEFEDKRYAFGPAPTYDKRNWFKEKYNMGLAFPILPYYIDGDLKISQPMVVMKYLARKHQLDGKSEQEKLRIDMIVTEVEDMKTVLLPLIYSPDFAKKRVQYELDLPKKIKEFSEFLGNNQWFGSSDISYADIVAYEFIYVLKLLVPSILDEFVNLQQFMQRFENLPTIKKYMNSPKFLKYPVTGKIAYWGN